MRVGRTHFEQIPIEVVATVLRQVAEGMPEKSPALPPAAERQGAAQIPEQGETIGPKRTP
jgi:hypothetical protein